VTRAPVTVLIVDDHAAIRAGLRFILETAGDIRVVGEAADGGSAVANAAALQPDVVLMDIRMPNVDGIEATGRITGSGPSRVLVLTTFDIDDYVFGALRAGAAGFLLKTVEPAALLDAVRRVADGDAALAPEVMRTVLDAFVALDAAHPSDAESEPGRLAVRAGPAQPDRTVPGSGYGLTERERDVLHLLSGGLSNQDISRHLHISAGTTKTHVSRVLAKLGCATRTQAAIIAREEGITGGR
jgi:DNA-binding NarL/FixJ family response regulator